MIIASVLKSGCEFKAEHVIALKKSVLRHNSNVRFVCLSDIEIDGVECVKLENDWPKWWGKIELFKVFTDEPILYLDIDTVVIGDISELFRTKFTMLQDVNDLKRFGSGVMAWHGDYSYLYDIFKKDAMKFIDEYKTRQKWGDQGFLMDNLTVTPDSFEFGPLHSYKVHCSPKVPNGTKLVYFHGKPRPWEIDLKRAGLL